MRGRLLPITIGDTYGYWTVQSGPIIRNHMARWVCRCVCGTEREVYAQSLHRGKSKSCGCKVPDLIRPQVQKHGLVKTSLHNRWLAMKQRCTNPNASNYKQYGARGISVCPEWLTDFSAFADWALVNGYRPELRLDRINTNGNYEPANCRWITNQQNTFNTRPKINGSGFKGISWNKRRQAWGAYIKVGDRQHFLGYHQAATEAARAYDRAALRYFGEFALTNTMLGLIPAENRT